MVLGFKEKINGKPTLFVSKIMYGLMDQAFLPPHLRVHPKIHTIRRGNRWKAGMSIQMATGVRTKNYHCFNDGLPMLQTVISVQNIYINNIFDDQYGVKVDGKELTQEQIEELAKNDGFDTVAEFWDFFKWEDFVGQIIHWTHKQY